jgi:hypothetical protein
LADLRLSVRHLRDLPARWGPVFHTSLVLVDQRELPLVIGGDKGQGALWLVPFIPPPRPASLLAPLVTYEDVFRPGHVSSHRLTAGTWPTVLHQRAVGFFVPTGGRR